LKNVFGISVKTVNWFKGCALNCRLQYPESLWEDLGNEHTV